MPPLRDDAQGFREPQSRDRAYPCQGATKQRLAVAKDEPRAGENFRYLLNFSDAQPASLVKLTLWVEPRTTTVMVPEIPYS
jgi:hypothetical protein